MAFKALHRGLKITIYFCIKSKLNKQIAQKEKKSKSCPVFHSQLPFRRHDKYKNLFTQSVYIKLLHKYVAVRLININYTSSPWQSSKDQQVKKKSIQNSISIFTEIGLWRLLQLHKLPSRLEIPILVNASQSISCKSRCQECRPNTKRSST